MPITSDIPESGPSYNRQPVQVKAEEFRHLVENPAIGSSANKKTQELWDRLKSITEAAGRDDYAAEIFNMCSSLDDITDPALSVNQLFRKIAMFGDVAVRVLAWKSIASHLLMALDREFKQWVAERSEECHRNALETALKATYIITDSNGKEKTNRFTPSSIQPSSLRLEEALIRLYPEEYEERKTLIEYVKQLADTAHDLYFIIQAAHKANTAIAEDFKRNGA